MPALNYMKRFSDSVKAGAKKSTIRKQRKNPINVGDTLYQYTGMRTKNCIKLREDVCTMVRDICIKPTGTVLIDGQALYSASIEEIALGDGFSSQQQFVEFFCQDGEEFRGQYIQW